MSAAEKQAAMLPAALRYVGLGWAVFPLAPRAKRPHTHLAAAGVKDASRDEETARHRWRLEPTANVGIACGAPSGVDVLDVDGPDGEAALAELERQHGPLPPTIEALTARGRHLYFRADDRVTNSARKLGAGLDTRGQGGYVVAPPSLHPNGRRYAWRPGHAPGEREIAPWPSWVVEVFAPSRGMSLVGHMREAKDHVRAWAESFAERKAEELAAERKGSRNGALNRSTYACAGLEHCGLARSFVHRLFLDACTRNGLIEDDGRRAFEATFASGWNAGRGEPWEPDWRSEGPRVQPLHPERGNASTSPFADWRTVGEHGDWLTAPPPPREYLLERDGEGALATGIAAILAAPGGHGKTSALVQLALSVATGRDWLDTFRVRQPGRVVIALAEEDMEELQRKLFYAAKALGLDAHERGLAARGIVPLGLKGHMLGLVSLAPGGGVLTTPVHGELRERLGETEHALLILDPLSRWAPDVESSNALATGAVQALEQLTQGPGTPTVVVAHHTPKSSRKEGNEVDHAQVRGVTGLVDAVRWVGGLGGVNAEDLHFAISKSNYSRHGDRVDLVRGEYGMLRAVTAEEAAERADRRDGNKAKKAEAEEAKVDALAEEILDAMRQAARPFASRSEIKELVRGDSGLKSRALSRLKAQGRIVGDGRKGGLLPADEDVEGVA